MAFLFLELKCFKWHCANLSQKSGDFTQNHGENTEKNTVKTPLQKRNRITIFILQNAAI